MNTNVSRTHVKDKTKRKTNPILIETIFTARKNKNWFHLAHILSGSTSKFATINLSELDAKTTPGDTVVIPGKVLGSGNLTKKIRICALSASADTMEKLKKTKSEFVSILDEIKKNPKAEGIKIIK